MFYYLPLHPSPLKHMVQALQNMVQFILIFNHQLCVTLHKKVVGCRIRNPRKRNLKPRALDRSFNPEYGTKYPYLFLFKGNIICVTLHS